MFVSVLLLALCACETLGRTISWEDNAERAREFRCAEGQVDLMQKVLERHPLVAEATLFNLPQSNADANRWVDLFGLADRSPFGAGVSKDVSLIFFFLV